MNVLLNKYCESHEEAAAFIVHPLESDTLM